MLEDIAQTAAKAVRLLIKEAELQRGDVLIIGCSTSEIAGKRIGSCPGEDIAKALFEEIYPVTKTAGVYLAAQCCEHLNRAVVLQRSVALENRLTIVSVVPKPHAGGSFASCCYTSMEDAVVVEELGIAKAGMDIGNTLIGMHLAKVAVPVRLEITRIGEAAVVFAKTRPKLIGGERACYS